MSDTYNGYKNHATWCINLWYNPTFEAMAKDFKDAESLASFLRDLVEEDFRGLHMQTGAFKELLGSAIRSCDFYYIAELLMDGNETEDEESEVEKEPINITVSQARFDAMVKALTGKIGKKLTDGGHYAYFSQSNSFAKVNSLGKTVIYWNLDKPTKQE